MSIQNTKSEATGFAKRLVRLLGVLALVAMTGCATKSLRDVVPQNLTSSATVVGFDSSDLRTWGDEAPKHMAALAKEFRAQRVAAQANGSGPKRSKVQNLLVISGGGSDGAFGAGLLNGWTKQGKRPEFVVVTGVSAGALMAPFAFLGPKYDSHLREFYTLYSTKDILKSNVVSGLISGSAIGDSEPLQNLIAKYLTTQVMQEIAAEHAKGRRLFIGTTNIDAERSVIWNIGGIATVGTDKALQLIHKIVLASAAIPAVFPPVMIDVQVNGQLRQEMHVDGGTVDNVVLFPMETNLELLRGPKGKAPKLRLYVVANSHVAPQWKRVQASTIAIAGRSIVTLIKQKTIGDILKLYGFAKKNKIDFNLATLPDDFSAESKEPFDRSYMKKLYQVGESLGRNGYKWHKAPIVR
ncbi:MAG: patatin-like phospholipase family protein [Hyphomicrobiaceae bacterium]